VRWSINGILVEEMAHKGVEVILGATRDSDSGGLVMFGLGGTFVEVMKDVSFRLAPMWLHQEGAGVSVADSRIMLRRRRP
jgi:acyl-CoA synthetase (NDP forming)